MQNKIAKYILFFFLTLFITNAALSILEKKNDSKAICMQSEDDNSDEPESVKKDPSLKKFQFNPNTLPFDDDICHAFHFSNYFVQVKQIKYTPSVPSLLDAAVSELYSPPKI